MVGMKNKSDGGWTKSWFYSITRNEHFTTNIVCSHKSFNLFWLFGTCPNLVRNFWAC